jgi:hypothetical protein
MLNEKKEIFKESAILKKVSIVQSFYNPLDSKIKAGFKEIWINHFKQPETTFYKRLRSPILEDLALIYYFLEIKNKDSHIVEYFQDRFIDSDFEPLKTYKFYA